MSLYVHREVKKLRGTYQASRDKDLSIDCIKDSDIKSIVNFYKKQLNKDELKVFKDTLNELVSIRTISTSDLELLKLYSEVYILCDLLKKTIEEEGLLLSSTVTRNSITTVRQVRNPLLTDLTANRGQLIKLSNELGLSILSKSKVKQLGKKEDAEDKLVKLLDEGI